MVRPDGRDLQLKVAPGNSRSLVQGRLRRASWRLKCLERRALEILKLFCLRAGRWDIAIRVRRARFEARPLKTWWLLWMMAVYDIREQNVHLIKTIL